MRIKREIVILAYVFLFPFVTLSQDNKDFQCASSDVSSSISTVQDALQEAQTAASSEDIPSALNSLKQIEEISRSIQSKCLGWNFEGTNDDVIGPIELESGVYIVEYNVDVSKGAMILGVISAKFENIDENELLFDNILETYSEAGQFPGRKSIRLKGGRYLFSVTASGLNSWSVNLSKP